MTYSSMQIQNIHTIRPQLLQTNVGALQDLVPRVISSVGGVDDLGSQRQAAVLPARLARESFLLSANVHARRVDFVVPPRLEEVEDLAELGNGGDARARLGVGAKGHET